MRRAWLPLPTLSAYFGPALAATNDSIESIVWEALSGFSRAYCLALDTAADAAAMNAAIRIIFMSFSSGREQGGEDPSCLAALLAMDPTDRPSRPGCARRAQSVAWSRRAASAIDPDSEG